MTAGIGILAQASPMMQDMFKRTPLEAGAVVSLISLFNAGGRFMWASGSDYIGRRNTYTIFFVTQFVLFLLIPRLAASGNWWLFQASLFVVFTMYGGGFATIPAFLADIFGPQNVGAIHGALLTAWTRGGHRRAGHHYGAVEPRESRASAGRGSCQYLRHAAAGARGSAGCRVRVDAVGAAAASACADRPQHRRRQPRRAQRKNFGKTLALLGHGGRRLAVRRYRETPNF